MVTFVSCFYLVNNKHGDSYKKWFNTTLRVNAPYVFFGTKESIDLVTPFRQGLPTIFVERNISDFVTFPFRHKMKTHPVHCPSVELNLVWNEKVFMLRDAASVNPFRSEFFAWIDAGICTYRDRPPPLLGIQTTRFLDHHRFNYTASNPYRPGIGYDSHHVSGTLFVIPVGLLPTIARLYFEKLGELTAILTDQVVLTHLFESNKPLFHRVCDGYGTIFPKFYDVCTSNTR